MANGFLTRLIQLLYPLELPSDYDHAQYLNVVTVERDAGNDDMTGEQEVIGDDTVIQLAADTNRRVKDREEADRFRHLSL